MTGYISSIKMKTRTNYAFSFFEKSLRDTSQETIYSSVKHFRINTYD